MNQKQLSFIFFFLSLHFLFAASVYSAVVFGPQDLTVSRWHYHFSHHTFAVDTEGKGNLTVTKTTLDKKIRGGALSFIIPG